MNWRKNVLSSIDDFDPLSAAEDDIRLQVFLARAGVCSRRGAAEVLTLGRVRVNGGIIREPGFRIQAADQVTLDGQPVRMVAKHIYLALNKPVGFVCSNDDPEGRRLAVDLLTSYRDKRLFSVGRLDFLSRGLLFFTNDGAFANLISHPRNAIEKEYLVETRKEIPISFLEEFKTGIYFDEERYRIHDYQSVNPKTVSLVLTEGKNREIRLAFAARKQTIKSLTRVRIGCVKLETLPDGRYRELQNHEINWLIDQSTGAHRGRRH
jgi:23S rRNA pseudouridine2605 synthase